MVEGYWRRYLLLFWSTAMTFVNAPVQDLLIRIKNAYMARRHRVENVVHSKFKTKILDLLVTYKFVRSYDIRDDAGKKFIDIDLFVTGNLNEDVPVVKLYSKPSKRWYVGWKDLRPVAWWIGIGIISTSQWLMATHEAKKKKIGWELIAEIY